MTRRCTCDIPFCDGTECFTECDPDAVELWESIKRLSEEYRMTEVRGDPLRHVEPKSRRAA